MSLYLDASAIVPIFVREPSSRAIVAMIETLPDVPRLSDFGAGEFASAISRHVRMGTFSASDALTILSEFDRWTAIGTAIIETTPRDLREAAMIVRRFDLKLRFPDALHLAICNERRLKVITRDKLMAEAASALRIDVQMME